MTKGRNRLLDVLAVLILILSLIWGRNAIGEELAQREVRRLMELALPPGSAILYGPFISGVGNNPRSCYGDSREAIVGSSMTEEQNGQYYSGKLGGWRQSTPTQGMITWQKSGWLLDSMVSIEYSPQYLADDSNPGQALMRGKDEYRTAYLLGVYAGRCTGPFP